MPPTPETAGTNAPSVFHLGYRPCLDGFRGVAIIGVVVLHSHLFISRSAFIGVQMFFVLSGFLITSLLLAEWDRRRTFSIKRFYLRRALRLLPALLAMLVTVTVYEACCGPRENAIAAAKDALEALFYCRNWVEAFAAFTTPSPFDHTWSLSIEEQFYLLWPLVLLLALRHTASRRSLLWWVLLAVALSLCARFLLLVSGAPYQRVYFGTDTRCDALLVGCAGAIALGSGLFPEVAWVGAVRRWAALGAVLGLLVMTFYNPAPSDAQLVVEFLLISWFALCLLLQSVSAESGMLSRALSQPWLVYIGKISYGIYLWHLPIFLHVQAKQWPKTIEIAVEFALTIAAVLASYYFLERPFLKMKARVGVRS